MVIDLERLMEGENYPAGCNNDNVGNAFMRYLARIPAGNVYSEGFSDLSWSLQAKYRNSNVKQATKLPSASL
jgi:hypothetical protein